MKEQKADLLTLSSRPACDRARASKVTTSKSPRLIGIWAYARIPFWRLKMKLIDGYMLAPAVARLFGVKSGTLAKWRRVGKGPSGWVRTSATTVHYPLAEVVRFAETWTAGSGALP